jgi:NADH:ubiquinone oxidoreductase subunit C
MAINKIEIKLEELYETIKGFYDSKKHHFLTLNGVALSEEEIEIQWIFSQYEAQNQITLFYACVNNDEVIPSLVSLIPSAIISQREIVDMFDISIEDTQKGLYLDQDSLKAPLSMGCAL